MLVDVSLDNLYLFFVSQGGEGTLECKFYWYPKTRSLIFSSKMRDFKIMIVWLKFFIQ